MRTSRCSVTRPVHNQVILKVILNKHCYMRRKNGTRGTAPQPFAKKFVPAALVSLFTFMAGQQGSDGHLFHNEAGKVFLHKICDLLISFTAWQFTAQDSGPNISGVVDLMLVTDKGSPSTFQQCSTYYI